MEQLVLPLIPYSLTSMGPCTDCGLRDTDPSTGGCTNDCLFKNDGECDDGGPGAVTFSCRYGTDCTDCGARGGL